jgi:hypothetical protein
MVLVSRATELSADNPFIQNFTIKDGLPSNNIYQVYKDSKNFLWFVSDAGAARYDGTQFTIFTKKDGLSSNDIIRMKEDSFGRIWFFNFNGTLNYFYNNKIYNPTNAPFLDSLKIKHFWVDFFQDVDSTIYFYSFQSTFIASLNTSNEVKKIITIVDSISKDGFERVGFSVTFVSRSPQNDFLIWSSKGLFKWNDFEQEPIQISDSIGYKSVYQLKHNKYLFQTQSTPDKICLLIEMIDGKLLPAVPDPIAQRRTFTSVIETDDNLLWFATKERGVFVMKDFLVINSISINECQGMVQDHEGNVWITTAGNGIFKISSFFDSCRHLDIDQFEDKGIVNMYPYLNMGIWLTNGNKIYLLQSNSLNVLDFAPKESIFDQIYYLNNNSLIIGKESYNFYQLTNVFPDELTGKIRYQTHYQKDPPIGYKAISISPRTGKIVARVPTRLFTFSNDGLIKEEVLTYLGERIHNSFFNLDDELVVNARKNYVYRNEELFAYAPLARFNNEIITDYIQINDSIEAINVDGDNIYLLCNDSVCNLTEAMNYSIESKIVKMCHHGKYLFLATFEHLYVCKQPERVHHTKSVDLKLLDVNFNCIRDMLVFQDSLYVASDQGLSIIPLTLFDELKALIPRPYFQSVQLNGIDTEIDKKMLHVTGSNRIRLSYSSINYSSSPVIYSYQIEGLDENWISETSRDVMLQNLAPGHYVFRVRAQKPGGIFSTPVEYNIQVSALLWKRPAFLGGIFLVLLTGIFWTQYRRQRSKRVTLEMNNQLIVLEMKALQSMMNPHFIFNVLGSIQNYLLLRKPDEAGVYLSQFARLIRQNLNAINSERVNLGEEVERLKNYLDLESLRFDHKFGYSIDFDENIEDEEEIYISSMIVQPFVENAVLHGVSHLKSDGMIKIWFGLYSENAVKVVIEDNGVGVQNSQNQNSKDRPHLHLGTTMTRKRLEILGKKHGIKTSVKYSEISPGKPNSGTRVVLIIPMSAGSD